MTRYFSNDPGSEATSLGLYVTGETYLGHNGYSLKLRGLSPGLNDMAEERAIVLHGAYYVSREAIRVLGRLGRSWGCPAVRAEIARKLIDTIRGGTAIFAYYPRTYTFDGCAVVCAAPESRHERTSDSLQTIR